IPLLMSDQWLTSSNRFLASANILCASPRSAASTCASMSVFSPTSWGGTGSRSSLYIQVHFYDFHFHTFWEQDIKGLSETRNALPRRKQHQAGVRVFRSTYMCSCTTVLKTVS